MVFSQWTARIGVLTISTALPAQISLPAPLSGDYIVDANGKGKGDRVFLDLATAIRYVSLVGVDGSITLTVQPGAYEGRLLFYPVPGLGEEERVVIRAAGGGECKLSADGAIAVLNEGCRNIVFDGLTFGESGGAPAILGVAQCTDIEIGKCRFEASSARKVIEIQGKRSARRWHIHHCRFDLGSGTQYGLYSQSTFELHIHHNEFVCDGVREAISIWNANKSESRVHDNLFRGRVNYTCMRLDVSGHDVDVMNNIFFIELPSESESVIRSQGLRNGAVNKIRHNTFVLNGEGSAVRTSGPISMDHNVYAVREGGIGHVKNDLIESLESWKESVAQFAVADMADRNSAAADKRFFDRHEKLLGLFHSFEDTEAEDTEDTEEEGTEEKGRAGSGSESSPRQVDPKVAARAEVKFLIGVLREGGPVATRLALARLVTHGRRAASAVPSLGKLCGHEHAAVRADAAEALGRIRIGAEIVIPELVKLLQDEDERVLLETIQTLGSFAHLAGDAAPQLKALESHKSTRVQNAATTALRAVMGDPKKKDGPVRDGPPNR